MTRPTSGSAVETALRGVRSNARARNGNGSSLEKVQPAERSVATATTIARGAIRLQRATGRTRGRTATISEAALMRPGLQEGATLDPARKRLSPSTSAAGESAISARPMSAIAVAFARG
jgi:hypothetical protein